MKSKRKAERRRTGKRRDGAEHGVDGKRGKGGKDKLAVYAPPPNLKSWIRPWKCKKDDISLHYVLCCFLPLISPVRVGLLIHSVKIILILHEPSYLIK